MKVYSLFESIDSSIAAIVSYFIDWAACFIWKSRYESMIMILSPWKNQNWARAEWTKRNCSTFLLFCGLKLQSRFTNIYFDCFYKSPKYGWLFCKIKYNCNFFFKNRIRKKTYNVWLLKLRNKIFNYKRTITSNKSKLWNLVQRSWSLWELSQVMLFSNFVLTIHSQKKN